MHLAGSAAELDFNFISSRMARVDHHGYQVAFPVHGRPILCPCIENRGIAGAWVCPFGRQVIVVARETQAVFARFVAYTGYEGDDALAMLTQPFYPLHLGDDETHKNGHGSQA